MPFLRWTSEDQKRLMEEKLEGGARWLGLVSAQSRHGDQAGP